MKTLNSFISTALVVTIAFAACTGSTSNTESTASTDTSSATMASTSSSDKEQLDANRKIATDFIQGLLGDKDSTAIDKYLADDIKQHNPLLQDGKEWLKNALRPFLQNPNIEKTKVNIEMTAAEGDMVWLLIKDVAPNQKVFARVTIFRIANGKIAEAWKVAEPVPAKSQNDNTMF